jgi:hypothetical protein
MPRILALAILAAAACTHAQQAPLVAPYAPVTVEPVAQTATAAPAPQPTQPENLVCRAFHSVNEKATCVPYLTDKGEHHTHSAMVTLGQQQFHCSYSDQLTGVLCADPIVIRQQPVAQAEDASAAKQPAAKSKAKK